MPAIVYLLRHKTAFDKEQYVGSTCMTATERFANHRHRCAHPEDERHSRTKLYNYIRENGGVDEWEIVVVEVVEAVDGEDISLLRRIRERHYYDLFRPALNDKRPHVSCEEAREESKVYIRQWRADHKEEIRAKQKEYRDDPERKKTSAERAKAWRAANRDRVRANRERYYAEHGDAIRAKEKQRYHDKKAAAMTKTED